MNRLPIDDRPGDVFTYSTAIGYEEGVSRRDPSPVIRVGSEFHVWYSRAAADASGHDVSICHATSEDGRNWTEKGEALSCGGPGAWDEQGVSSPTILVAEGRYFLYYTAAAKTPDNDGGEPNGTATAIGVAFADSPRGPWTRFSDDPVLRPGEDDLPPVETPGDGRLSLWPEADEVWDSHSVSHACLLVRGGSYWVYYQGRRKGLSPGETGMGLAIAPHPTGPFEKHRANPVLEGTEGVCLWPQRRGVAALVAPAGPAGGTLQYSADGVRFVSQAEVTPPAAPGPFREDHFASDVWGKGITWGLCHNLTARPKPFLMRFDCDLRAVEW